LRIGDEERLGSPVKERYTVKNAVSNEITTMMNARKVTALLLRRYPDPKLALCYSNPLELLIAVILSAQCTDARVNDVTRTLFKKYRTAQDYADAKMSTLEQEIRPTGFYKNKAKNVIGCCKRLVADFGGAVPKSLEGLTTLPGVGRKTANMVLGNGFGLQAIAVDTHVLRVSNRLGLARAKDPDKVEAELLKQVPADKLTAFSNAMILHGRETCTARAPRCHECVLYDVCAWPEKPRR
jgi:endonuclease III